MSYFSHNPEAWDDIETSAVAHYLTDHMGDEDLTFSLAEALGELQIAEQGIWRQLVDKASVELDSAQQVYWDSFVQ